MLQVKLFVSLLFFSFIYTIYFFELILVFLWAFFPWCQFSCCCWGTFCFLVGSNNNGDSNDSAERVIRGHWIILSLTHQVLLHNGSSTIRLSSGQLCRHQPHSPAPRTVPPEEPLHAAHAVFSFLTHPVLSFSFARCFVCPCAHEITVRSGAVASQQESCGFESQRGRDLLRLSFSHFMFLPLYPCLLRVAPEYLIMLNYWGPQP